MSSLSSISSSSSQSISSINNALSNLSLSTLTAPQQPRGPSLRTQQICNYLSQYMPSLVTSITRDYVGCDLHGAEQCVQNAITTTRRGRIEAISEIVSHVLHQRETDRPEESHAVMHYFGNEVRTLNLNPIPKPHIIDDMITSRIEPRTLNITDQSHPERLHVFLERMLNNPNHSLATTTLVCQNMQFNQENFQVLTAAARQGRGVAAIDLQWCWSNHYDSNDDRSYQYLMEFLRASHSCPYWHRISLCTSSSTSPFQGTAMSLLSHAFAARVRQGAWREELPSLGLAYSFNYDTCGGPITSITITRPPEQKNSQQKTGCAESGTVTKGQSWKRNGSKVMCRIC